MASFPKIMLNQCNFGGGTVLGQVLPACFILFSIFQFFLVFFSTFLKINEQINQ